MASPRPERDPTQPVYVISVAATLVSAHPRTLRIYEDEGLLCPARTPTNIRLYSENDIRRILWIRHLTRERGVNLAGIRILFELEERLGARILEALYAEGTRAEAAPDPTPSTKPDPSATPALRRRTLMAKRPSTPVDEQPTTTGPRELPLVALRETVIFPEMIVPLQVGREKSVNALNAAVADGGPIALVTQRQAEQEDIDDPVRALRRRHPREDRPGRAAPGRHRPGDRPGPVARARPRLDRDQPVPARDHRGADRRQPRQPRGPGAHAQRPGPDRAVRRQRRPGPAGGRRRGAQHQRARAPGRHGRLQPGHVHRAAPGAARDDRHRRAPQARLDVPRPPDRDPRAEGPDPVRGQVRDGQDPARVHPARAAQGHPARAGRGRPAAGRDQRAARQGRSRPACRTRSRPGRSRRSTG